MPFQGLFLALFFVTVGMSIDATFILKNAYSIALYSLGLLAVKFLVIAAICRLFNKMSIGSSIHSGLLLAQGGEFAFILFSMLTQAKILSHDFGQQLLMVVTCTMAITPLLALLGLKLEQRLNKGNDIECKNKHTGANRMRGHVVIAGFGRVGRVVAFMLQEQGIDYLAIDSNASLVRKARKQGFNVYHGDISRKEDMDSVNLADAIAVVISITDTMATARVTKVIHRKLPDLPMIVKVEDYRHSRASYKLGAFKTIPATVEIGIEVGSAVLEALEIGQDSLGAIQQKMRRNQYAIIGEIELFKDAVAQHDN